MACKVFQSTETNVLGFLFTKQVIDANRKVLNKQLADFYLGVFNRQLQRANVTGTAYTIEKGEIIPNSTLLAQFDNNTPDQDFITDEISNYNVEEQLSNTAMTNRWTGDIESDLINRYGEITTGYIKNLVNRGHLETQCD